MSEPYVGEIRIFGFNFPPRNWAFCNGQIMSIAQNTALFSILGTTYGGNGQTNFALPNFQGTAPMHWGDGSGLTPRVLGESFGSSQITLLTTEMPAHTHGLNGAQASAPATQLVATPSSTAWEGQSTVKLFGPTPVNTTFHPSTVNPTGGSQPHNNVQPILALSFCICLYGVFPARN